MRRPDRGTLRAAGFTALMVTVFLTVNTSVAQAATGSGGGGLLEPLEIDTSEGVPLTGYELGARGGGLFDGISNFQAGVIGGMFTMARVGIGLVCWVIEMAYRFPLLKILTKPAQRLSDVYTGMLVDTLGLKGMLLSWAFVFGLVLVMRGKYARGFGEIALTLVIGALSASVFVTPNFLLGKEGPLLQAQSAAADVAQQTIDAHTWGGKVTSDGPCSALAGNDELKCLGRLDAAAPQAQKIARPIQDAITNSLVVKPYMLLQYGRILDPSKPADRKAYAVHLKWITGGYDYLAEKPPTEDELKKKYPDSCKLIKGPAKKYCLKNEDPYFHQDNSDAGENDDSTTSGPLDELLDPNGHVATSTDELKFEVFLADLKKAGPVGQKCAEYAGQTDWWRVAAVFMVFLAALLICALLLSASMVLIGVTAVCAGAAAVGSGTFVWGMLPGPSRTVVWKWLALFGIAVGVVLGVSAFIPAVGITMDVVLTDGPDLLAERLLILDVLALVGLAFHRRLLVMITSFGHRMSLRMRYAKIGGSHLAGDSQLGAALAMSLGGSGSSGMALVGGSLRGRGLTGLGMGTGSLLQGVGRGLTDGAGMLGDPRRLLADANAEASRGLAPIGLAVAGAGIAAGGAWSALVGRRPDDGRLVSLRKPVASGSAPAGSAANGQGPGGGGGRGGSGPRGPRPGGPSDRYRDANGQIVSRSSGEVLHDQNDDRTLLSTRAHNRLVRLRAYRAAHTGGRMLYGATVGLPATARTVSSGTSNATHDVRQQMRVWSNTLRQDGQAWGSMLQGAAQRVTPSSRRLRSSSASSRPSAAPAASTVTVPVGGTSGPTPTAGVSSSVVRPPRPPRPPRPAPGAGAGGGAASGASAGHAGAGFGGTVPSAGTAPAGSTRRVRRAQPRTSGNGNRLGSSASSRRDAQEMFRRIRENNRNMPRPSDDGGDEE
jgi:hypothetical protein